MGQVQTTIRFRCPECGEAVVVQADVPEVDWSHDSPGDSLSEDNIDIECPSCDAVFDALVQNSPSHCAVELTEYPDIEVGADDAPFSAHDPWDNDENWINSSSSPNPWDIFMEHYWHIDDIVSEYGNLERATLVLAHEVINRMAFSSMISAMEAYLSDTLINAVTTRRSVLGRLISTDGELQKKTVSLEDVFKNSNVASEVVREQLSKVLYYNLGKVRNLYRSAFDVDIIENEEIQTSLSRAVGIRHDIVHRNGKTISGDEHHISGTEVTALMHNVRRFLDHVKVEVEHSLWTSDLNEDND